MKAVLPAAVGRRGGDDPVLGFWRVSLQHVGICVFSGWEGHGYKLFLTFQNIALSVLLTSVKL